MPARRAPASRDMPFRFSPGNQSLDAHLPARSGAAIEGRFASPAAEG